MLCTATHRIEKGETVTAVFASCAPDGGFHDDMGEFPGQFRYLANLVMLDSDFLTGWQGNDSVFAVQVQQFWFCGPKYDMTHYL
jgi:hypothetical protein